MSRKPEVEILARLDALFQDPSRFTKHTLALDRKGGTVAFDSPDAYSFCSRGGIHMIARQLFGDAAAKQHAIAAEKLMLECAARVLPQRVSLIERWMRRMLRLQPARYTYLPLLNDVEGLEGVQTVLKEAVHV